MIKYLSHTLVEVSHNLTLTFEHAKKNKYKNCLLIIYKIVIRTPKEKHTSFPHPREQSTCFFCYHILVKTFLFLLLFICLSFKQTNLVLVFCIFEPLSIPLCLPLLIQFFFQRSFSKRDLLNDQIMVHLTLLWHLWLFCCFYFSLHLLFF